MWECGLEFELGGSSYVGDGVQRGGYGEDTVAP